MRTRATVCLVSVILVAALSGCGTAPPTGSGSGSPAHSALVTVYTRTNLSDEAKDSAWSEIDRMPGVVSQQFLQAASGEPSGSRLVVTLNDTSAAPSFIHRLLQNPYVLNIVAHRSEPASDIVFVEARP